MVTILEIVCFHFFSHIQKCGTPKNVSKENFPHQKKNSRSELPLSILLLCSPISFCGYCIILWMYLPPPLAQFRGYNTDAMLSKSFSQRKTTKKRRKITRRQAPYTFARHFVWQFVPKTDPAVCRFWGLRNGNGRHCKNMGGLDIVRSTKNLGHSQKRHLGISACHHFLMGFLFDLLNGHRCSMDSWAIVGCQLFAFDQIFLASAEMNGGKYVWLQRGAKIDLIKKKITMVSGDV